MNTTVSHDLLMAAKRTIPLYSKTRVRKAGQIATGGASDLLEQLEAIDVLNNWRAAHGTPLIWIAQNVRNAALSVSPKALVVRRTKRMPSVIQKLERYPTMGADRIQDYGGVRAIMGDVEEVRAVAGRLRASRQRHKYVGGKDYIDQPDLDGYRGVHQIYAFESRKFPEHAGLRIEVQIRTQIQHAWATAVETMGFVSRQALKSDKGDPELLEFFRELASEFALMEGSPLVPGTIQDREERLTRIRDLEREHAVGNRLLAYAVAIQNFPIPIGEFEYAILELSGSMLQITIYDDFETAENEYVRKEKNAGLDVVLVSADDMSSLERAYPNYFADTTFFRRTLHDLLQPVGWPDGDR